MRTLVLTSPHMRGPDVRNAQELLTENALGRDFMQGSRVDGEYGPWTHRATIRAKHWCGYRKGALNGAYGPFLHAFLKGEAKLPVTNRRRRKRRERRLETAASIGQRAYAEAGKDILARVTENPPGSNRNYITVTLYKLVGPWCAMATSVWWVKAGSTIPRIGGGYRGRYHYCPTIFADATEGRNGLSLVKPDRAVTGDWVLFDWGGDRVADHVGLFGHWIVPGHTFETREGNTSYEGQSGSQSDGGAAASRTRNLSQVARNSRGDYGFVHPGR